MHVKCLAQEHDQLRSEQFRVGNPCLHMTGSKLINTMSTPAFNSNRNLPSVIFEHISKVAVRGEVTSVIDAIDKYCYEVQAAMNVGDVKGKILDRCLEEAAPKNVLELGTFCGYSALRMARVLNDGAMLYTIEANPEFAAVAQKVVSFAGMDHKIKILIGESDQVLPTIAEKCGVQDFDFVFIDHWKSLYKRDLLMLEDLALIRPGSTILADNIIYPGCPDYVEYVRNSPKYKCTNYPSKLEYSDQEDALEKSVYQP